MGVWGKRLALLALVTGAVLWLTGIVPGAWVLAPLLGYLILRLGLATFGSLARGAAHVPSGEPQPVDPDRERVTYWCEGCGAELLLLVRGTGMPPRHCGERMHERAEVPRDSQG